MPLRRKCMKKDAVVPMLLPDSAEIYVQNLELIRSNKLNKQTNKQTYNEFYIVVRLNNVYTVPI